MIPDTVLLFQRITSTIDAAIVDDYDAFVFDCIVGDSYLEYTLSVSASGQEDTSLSDEIDSMAVNQLVDELRGNPEWKQAEWSSFVISYRRGERVNVTFGKKRAAWDTRG